MILKSKKIKIFASVLFALSLILLFSIGVSAAIVPKIDFEDETIKLTGGSAEGNEVVKYMYCPNVNPELSVKADNSGNVINDPAEKKKLAMERWYPVYGDTIDISGFIPRANEIKFAFRDADEFPDADGVYKSRVLSPYIPCRPASITKTYMKNNIKYNPKNETIDITNELADGYEYKVGISEWLKKQDSGINVSSEYNALGNTVSIRKSATGASFASIEYKIKIPKAPPVPKVKINKGKIIGISLNQVYATAPESAAYSPFKSKIIDINDVENQLGFAFNGKDYVDIYIKTPATDKKPSSPIQKLRILNPEKNK